MGGLALNALEYLTYKHGKFSNIGRGVAVEPSGYKEPVVSSFFLFGAGFFGRGFFGFFRPTEGLELSGESL